MTEHTQEYLTQLRKKAEDLIKSIDDGTFEAGFVQFISSNSNEFNAEYCFTDSGDVDKNVERFRKTIMNLWEACYKLRYMNDGRAGEIIHVDFPHGERVDYPLAGEEEVIPAKAVFFCTPIEELESVCIAGRYMDGTLHIASTYGALGTFDLLIETLDFLRRDL